MELTVGRQAVVTVETGPRDTAAALGSGDVPVLGTPRLLALAEAATVRALDGALPPGQTSVGTSVRLEHTAASPVGMRITVTAHPAVSVPAGLTAAGLPVGLQLVGRYGADRRLLEIAAAIMELTG